VKNLILLIMMGVSGCFSSEAPLQLEKPKEVYGQLLNHFAQVVDLRPQSAIKETGIISGSVVFSKEERNSPNSWIVLKNQLNTQRKVVLVSTKNDQKTIEEVARKLRADGFKTAYLSSFEAWMEAKLPIQKQL
tara:strand:+ start:129 stop:527 length:399 start_codon:yes stop_codon:yes gene_type:complete